MREEFVPLALDSLYSREDNATYSLQYRKLREKVLKNLFLYVLILFTLAMHLVHSMQGSKLGEELSEFFPVFNARKD